MGRIVRLASCGVILFSGLLLAQVEKVGEEVYGRSFRSAASEATFRSTKPQIVWQEEIKHEGATYIAPFFSKMDLPEGSYLVVRSPGYERSWVYKGRGKMDLTDGKGFWGIHIPGDTLILELYSKVAVPADAVVVSHYARGYTDEERGFQLSTRSICGSDDSKWAKCYQSSEPTVYSKSKAVARLLINGTNACTGWLVGSEGHLMTNNHCISTSSEAANTNFEFMAEGSSCSTDCSSWGACAGVVEADRATLIKTSATYDYTLVKLPVNVTNKYGYFQMRSSGPTLGERIYIPQHPAHWGKKIALKAGSSNATITTLNAASCGGTVGDIGYMADTQGGSSGSPVVSYNDHLVVAIHHCGGCENRGIRIDNIISDLGSALPADAVPGSSGGGGGGGSSGDIQLSNGNPVTLNGASGSEKYAYIDVPYNASSLTIQISGGDGDADLYVKKGSKPSRSSYDCRPYKYGNNETCSFSSSLQGRWWIMIHGYSSYTNVSLVASYNTATPNNPPTASFTYSTSGLTVNFTDTSSDSDGSVVSWSWNFGDGNYSSSRNPSHTYSSGGSYTVRLTVTDDDGATDTYTRTITVTDPSGGGSSAPCTGCEHFTGYLSSGGNKYEPNGNYYYSSSGTHKGWLEGPSGTDFDLYLYKWSGSGWSVVKSSTSYDSSEYISYYGSSGYYIWRIRSYSGSGNYDFWLIRP